MIKRFILISLTTLLIGNYELKAQDPSFSQFYANLLYLNPAYAGSNKCSKISVNFRDQYPNLQHTYVTPSISFDKYVSNLSGGLGLLVYKDITAASAAAINTLNISGIYSNSLNVSKNFVLKTGFQVSYIQKNLNTSNLILPDMINGNYGAVNQTNENLSALITNKNNIDFSFGAIGFGKNYSFGFSVNHLIQPSFSFRENQESKLPIKYTLHAGTKITINSKSIKGTKTIISPNIMYQKQEKYHQISYGAYFNYSALIFGAFAKQNLKIKNNALVMLIGFAQKNYKIAYSYDLTLSKFKSGNGAHEISISAEICGNQK
jgi:type IX secretion system PorP/SprF family membrane protein